MESEKTSTVFSQDILTRDMLTWFR